MSDKAQKRVPFTTRVSLFFWRTLGCMAMGALATVGAFHHLGSGKISFDMALGSNRPHVAASVAERKMAGDAIPVDKNDSDDEIGKLVQKIGW